MKALYILAMALIVIGLALPAGAATTLQCIGSEGGGAGGVINCGVRTYVYRCVPAGPITSIEIPTGDGHVPNYTNICAPAGWNLAIVANTGLQHGAGKTPHGVIAPGPAGTCPFKMVWTGPAIAVPFEVGFDHPNDSHNAAWLTSDAAAASWLAQVGAGAGPVHSPLPSVPTLTEWGAIGVVLLLLLAGTLFILRNRRSSPAAA